ncbi:unnamed protein product, partial [Closterium sp. NIES-54]
FLSVLFVTPLPGTVAADSAAAGIAESGHRRKRASQKAGIAESGHLRKRTAQKAGIAESGQRRKWTAQKADSAAAGSAESGGKMSVSTSALYAIMFLCAAFVFSFLFRVLRALLLHAALLSPLPRRSDDPDSTIHVRTVLVIDGVPEGPQESSGEGGEAGRAGVGTRGKGLRAEEIAQHSDLIRYSEVKEERRVEGRELVVVEIGEREGREQGWESEKARAGKEGGAEAACEGQGQRGADREGETARAAAAVNGQGSEKAERRRDVDGPSERLVKAQQMKQETGEKGAEAAGAAEAGEGGAGGGRAGGGEDGEGGVEGVWGQLAVECSVCLTEFREEERVRRLHCCTHMFHQVSIEVPLTSSHWWWSARCA